MRNSAQDDKGINEPLLTEEPPLTSAEALLKHVKAGVLQRYQAALEVERQRLKTLDFEKRALAANIENSDQYAKTRIEYFSHMNLVPQRMQVSGRYIALLFEGNEGDQEYHVIHRFTHDLILRVNSRSAVKDFFLYDPFDCARYHTNKKSTAFIITLHQKPSEWGEQRLVLQKIQKEASSTDYSIPDESGQWASFAAVSADLSYAAISLVKELNAADFGGKGGYCRTRIQFVSIVAGNKMQKIGLTEGVDAFNPTWLDGSLVFVQNRPRAIVGHLLTDVSLVDVRTGAVLSKVGITAKKLALTYFQDVEQYGFISLDDSKTYNVKVEGDRLTFFDEEPLAFFDAKSSQGLCTGENPYNFSMKSLNGSYNKSQTTGFIINQKFFNLQMDDIRFSRVMILPGAKVFYAIKNSPPYTCFVVDLVNLEVQFQASVLDDQSATVRSYYNGTRSELVISDKAMKNTLVSDNVQQVFKFSNFIKANLPSVDASQVGYFDIQQNYLVIKIDTNVEVYDLATRQKVFSAFGIRVQISQDQSALVLNQGGYQFQVWQRNQSSGHFEVVVPSLKNVASRVEFVPGSNTRIAIYDERLKSLLCYDTVARSYSYIMRHAEFNCSEYNFIDGKYLYYKKKLVTGGTRVSLYNYIFGFIEKAVGIEGDTILVQESRSKKFIYVTTDDQIKVFTKLDLDIPVQTYPINQVYEIVENEGGTILKCKAQQSLKILVVGTLEPDQKVQDFTSSTFLMKYIFAVLSNKQAGTADKLYAIDVYSVFMQNGFVDSYFDNEGTTMLHVLIKDHSAEIFARLFLHASGPFSYINKFDESSVLSYAIEQQKMQHVKIMLDYFAENPKRLRVSSEDFINLLESSLPQAKQIIFAQFSEPSLYRAFLPFQVANKGTLFVKPVDTEILGRSQAELVEREINTHPGADAKLFQYSISAFKYNFSRGSQSSIDFVRAYAEEDDELVLRSSLRHIVDNKFKECMPFLLILASIFYVYLLLFFYAILICNAPWPVRTALIAFNTFFFLLECRQVVTEGWAYLEDFWNFIDIVAFGTNYFLFIYTGEVNQYVQFLFAIASFFMLLRGMSYLRIFGSLRYLINMVIEIMKDMSAFLILLVYWIVGYSFIFYIFSEAAAAASSGGATLTLQAAIVGTDEGTESPFAANLKEIYRLAYGDFGPDEYSPAKWLVFVIATFFLPLLMLNMVIALMGDTFGRVKEASAAVDMKEKARMVLEVESFISWKYPHQSEEEEDRLRQHVLIGYDATLADEDIATPEATKTETIVDNVLSSVQQLEKSVNEIARFKSDIIAEIHCLKAKA